MREWRPGTLEHFSLISIAHFALMSVDIMNNQRINVSVDGKMKEKSISEVFFFLFLFIYDLALPQLKYRKHFCSE